MPELPDVAVYIERLDARLTGRVIERLVLRSPFLVRTFDPPISEVNGRRVLGFRRIGKRIVFCLDDDLFLVLHLMVAGRLHWRKKGTRPNARTGLAAFELPDGTLELTEASKKKRASLHLVRGEASLVDFDRGGLEVFDITLEQFAERLRSENHTLKRGLTDPRMFSGIGNAYSDEILHRARLSPVKWTTRLTDEEKATLFEATLASLTEWTDALRAEVGDGFPERVTAFREDMAVHGRFRKPCPRCGDPVQRIVYADRETNYCATCQTDGVLLRDRALSQLLKKDWPKTLEEMEERRGS